MSNSIPASLVIRYIPHHHSILIIYPSIHPSINPSIHPSILLPIFPATIQAFIVAQKKARAPDTFPTGPRSDDVASRPGAQDAWKKHPVYWGISPKKHWDFTGFNHQT